MTDECRESTTFKREGPHPFCTIKCYAIDAGCGGDHLIGFSLHGICKHANVITASSGEPSAMLICGRPQSAVRYD